MRAHLRYLGIASGPSEVREQVQIEQVVVTELASRTLRRHLDTPGRWRGGLLFGETQDQTLNVVLTTSPGYPWYDG